MFSTHLRQSRANVGLAALFTVIVPVIGYASFGPWPALLFLVGYSCGFLLWLILPTRAPFSSIKRLYWAAFLLFGVHRVEEKVSGFFQTLSEMTGVAVPAVASVPMVLLLVTSVGAWLAGPWLYWRGSDFGRYLVWTFFASMGITELAHFVFPFFRSAPHGYFPGMLSVVALAPVAWFAMWRMTRPDAG